MTLNSNPDEVVVDPDGEWASGGWDAVTIDPEAEDVVVDPAADLVLVDPEAEEVIVDPAADLVLVNPFL